MSISDSSEYLLGKFGIIVSVILALYIIASCSYTLSYYNTFVMNILAPKVSIYLVCISIIVASCYGAYKGIEGLSRASGLILVGVLASFIFIICALMTKIDSYNFIPFLYYGNTEFIDGIKFMVSNSSCIALMGILFPIVKGNIKRGIICWNVSVYLILIILVTVIVGALGDYLKTQVFPIYAASSISEIGLFKRMDSLYIGIWTTAVFLKLAVYLYVFSLLIDKIFGNKAGRVAILIGGAIVAAISLWIVSHKTTYFFREILDYMLWSTITTVFLIPIILLIVDLVKSVNGKGLKDA